MPKNEKVLLAFNRGVVSKLGLGRLDIARMAMSAEVQTNFIPRVLGSMMLRPGLEHIGATKDDAQAKIEPFVFNQTDTAILEFGNQTMRIWVNDALVENVDHSTTDLNNPDFGSDITSWTANHDAGGAAAWEAGGYASINGIGENRGRINQSFTVGAGDFGKQHTLAVHIFSRGGGSGWIRVGTSAGGEEIMADRFMDTPGWYFFKFSTSTATNYVEISAKTEYRTRFSSVHIIDGSDTGDQYMELPTIWTPGGFDDMRFDQSGDIIYVAYTAGGKQQKIVRYSAEEWAVNDYESQDGPFRIENTTDTTIAVAAHASGKAGEVVLTASDPIFDLDMIDDTLFRISSVGQFVSATITGANIWTDPIKVTGSGTSERSFIYDPEVSGDLDTDTFTVQRSVAAPGAWVDAFTGTVVGPTSFYDALDEQIIYYRIGINTGDYIGATNPVMSLSYAFGSIDGVVRAQKYTNTTEIDAVILKALGGLAASSIWAEGEWSVHRGYPTAVALYEGRLWWMGRDKIWGSESDAYYTFDEFIEGDGAPISRGIGSGPVEDIHWALPLARLLLGTAQNSKDIEPVVITIDSPLSVRSSSFGEPLTNSNFNIKDDRARGAYVDRSGQRLYELTTSSKSYTSGVNEYSSEDLSLFAPDFNEAGIDKIAVQTKPDVRIHCVRSDGTVGMLVFDRAEKVICWVEVTSPGFDGLIKDVAVLPGTVEDQVYYLVSRDSGPEKYMLEKWALESEATGGLINKIADSFKVYDSTATVTPFGTTGLVHLADEDVVVWADGIDVGVHTVSATGGITLTVAASKVVAGLAYTGQFKSAKLAELEGVGLNRRRNIRQVGVTLLNTHYLGLQYGPSFSNLYDLPAVEGGQITPDDTVWAEYDEDLFTFGGEWNTDARLYLQAVAPRPCTIVTLTAIVET